MLVKEGIKMNNQKCKHCYYGDVCPSVEACDSFVSVTDEADDVEINEIIERNRKDFYTEWNTYIKEWT